MATYKVPYLKMRNGRPRWEPGPGLRRAGFTGRDLRDAQGRWLSEAAAITRAMELNAQVAAWRKSGEPRRRPAKPLHSTRDCNALWASFTRTPEWAHLAPKTRLDYGTKAKVWLETFGQHEVAAITRQHLKGFWRHLYRDRGHHMANGTIRVACVLLSYALDEGWLRRHPGVALKLTQPPPRVVVWLPEEIEALLAAADAIGLPQVGDAVVIALHTAQRQADVLALEMPQIRDGFAHFHPEKTRRSTGVRVRIPITPPLAERIETIRRRRRFPGVIAPFMQPRLVLNRNARPYSASPFGKDWRAVRAAASEMVPTCLEKKFLDFRDTAITRLALAGCTAAEIASISGHSMQTINSICRHYVALSPDMADAGTVKLIAWMEAERMAV